MAPSAEEALSTLASIDTPSPDVRAWMAKQHPKQLALLDRFEMELRLGRLSTSSSSNMSSQTVTWDASDRRLMTSRTVELLRSLIGSTRWRNAAQLMVLLRGVGRELHAAGGFREPAIGNVVRRIMCAVRDEVAAAADAPLQDNKDNDDEDMEKIDETAVALPPTGRPMRDRGNALSLSSMLWAHPQHVKSARPSGNRSSNLRSDSFSSVGSGGATTTNNAATAGGDLPFPPIFYANRPDLRQTIMEAIQEIMSDLEDMHKNINDQATSHIHAGEIILVYGSSKTIELFLKAAHSKKRKFQVVVCEGAPHFGGHKMAKSLADAGIETTVIHDAATFAIMARVNKVLLPAHAVLANGGLVGPSGANMVALAAKHNSIPVVIISGMFKLCPMYPHEGQDTLNDLVSPSSVVDYSEMSDDLMSKVEFVNPIHDYIPPQLINLYVTNIGGFQPSYLYRLLAEYYHSDDWESFE